MALYSQASDLKTRQTVWVSTNTKTGRQANSHTRSWDFDGDGLSAVELADLSTDYQGWQGPGHQYYCNPEGKVTTWVA